MRKDEPDSKYFGEINENEVFPAKIGKNHPKTVQFIYCGVAKELTGHTFQCFWVWRSSQFSK